MAKAPGIRTKPRSRARAKAELRVVKPAQNDPGVVARWINRVISLLLLKVRGRG